MERVRWGGGGGSVRHPHAGWRVCVASASAAYLSSPTRARTRTHSHADKLTWTGRRGRSPGPVWWERGREEDRKKSERGKKGFPNEARRARSQQTRTAHLLRARVHLHHRLARQPGLPAQVGGPGRGRPPQHGVPPGTVREADRRPGLGQRAPLHRPRRTRRGQGRAHHLLQAGRVGEAARDGVQEAGHAGVQAVAGGVALLEADAQVFGLYCYFFVVVWGGGGGRGEGRGAGMAVSCRAARYLPPPLCRSCPRRAEGGREGKRSKGERSRGVFFLFFLPLSLL